MNMGTYSASLHIQSKCGEKNSHQNDVSWNNVIKQRYGNHKKSFNHEKHRTDTELSKEYWRLKELKAQPQVQFYILKRCPPTKRTGICYLCLNEKLFIIEHQGNDLLNQRNELISKCRHKIKFKLMNHKT